MARSASIFAHSLGAGLLVATAAIAAPTSAEAPIDLHRPQVDQRPQGLRVHGAVCRAAPALPAGALSLRIEKLDAAGLVTASTTARQDLRPRNRTCAFYSVQTVWTATPGDTVRICATSHGRTVCA